jgi:hypothetical protein
MDKSEVFQKIETLTKQKGYVYTLSLCLFHDFFFTPEESADVNWHDRLSFQEASHLVGLLVKNGFFTDYIPSEEEYKLQAEQTYKLFQDLHTAYMRPFLDKLVETKPGGPISEKEFKKMSDKLFGSGEMMTEPIFYGDSGAYDFQYLEFASKRYNQDKDWLKNNYNFDPDTITSDIRKLKKVSENKHYPSKKSIQDFKSLCTFALDSFCFSDKDFDDINENSRNALLNSFLSKPGLSNTNYKVPGDFNETEAKPFIKLNDDRYFIPIFFFLTESIYVSPFYWMLRDDKYRDISFKNKGVSTEQIAYELLLPVFGPPNVYKNVQIIRKKGQPKTDIDVLAVTGNKAVIIQAKSKQMTVGAKKGDEKTLKQDFKKAVQASYDQAIESRSALLESGSRFIVNGKLVSLKEPLDDAYIICLTSENYPAVINQINTYLKKRSKDPFPVAINIFDLDILTFYLSDPYQFLYYLRQRISLSGYFNAGNEIAFLAYHLRTKLFKNPKADRIAIAEDFAQLVDANFISLRGGYHKTEAVEKLYNKWANDDFFSLIKQIKSLHEPGLTDAIFFLFDLSGDSADKVMELIKKMKDSAIKDNKTHDFSMIFDSGNSGITYICSPDDRFQSSRRLVSYCTLRKYKSNSNLWIGLASSTKSPNLVDQIIFNKTPWRSNKQLRNLSNKLLLGGKGIPAENI